MSEIKARYEGASTEGETLGEVLEDGDIYPLTVPHQGELPQEIDGRKVKTSYRDGLLAQEDEWTAVRRDKNATSAKAEKDGEN